MLAHLAASPANGWAVFLEIGDAPLRAPSLLCDALLQKEDCRRNHGDASVSELFLLHLSELCRVGGGQAERVETDLTGDVSWADRGVSLELFQVELAECNLDAVKLAEGDAEAHREPQSEWKL